MHTGAGASASAAGTPDTPGALYGSVFLIIGSTVGAGVLALPAVTQPIGAAPSSLVLVATWALLTLEAMLLVDVNLAVRARRPREEQENLVSMRAMAAATLGPVGSSAVSAAYLALSYALLVAYSAKVSDLVGLLGGAVAPDAAEVALTAAFFGLLLSGGERLVEAANTGLTGLLLLLFVGILAGASSQADWHVLTATAHWDAAPQAISIAFLSLVYHDLVPVICQLLDGDRRLITQAVLAGSVVPLAMFLAFNAVLLCAAGPPGDPLAHLVAQGGAVLGAAVAVFSLLAIFTSFAGTAIGLSATLASELQAVGAAAGRDLAPTQDRVLQRAVVLAVALGPPLAISLAHPGSFLAVLRAVGGYGMTCLWGIVPPLMAFSLSPAKHGSRGTLHPAALALAFLASVGVELDCLAKDGVLQGATDAVVPSIVTASQSLWHVLGALAGGA
ncbi:hypothetical protein WJX81_006296 [Elliptochloris bilobata]|uniref:Tyrosine-specific transport protein n=1 Tax=Elliptochloris bilobata TaxID=381761 RepID=A0AAW1QPU2_9CHLO